MVSGQESLAKVAEGYVWCVRCERGWSQKKWEEWEGCPGAAKETCDAQQADCLPWSEVRAMRKAGGMESPVVPLYGERYPLPKPRTKAVVSIPS